MDQRCPSPPPIVESEAHAQRITEGETSERQDRSFDGQAEGSYDHQKAPAEGGHTSSGATSYSSPIHYLLVLLLAKHHL